PLDNPDFLAYLRDAANPHHYGLRPDNRHYPYSAPEGRRIAHRQLLWDNAAYASGVTRAEADAQHLAALLQTRAALAARLASEHAADFDKLPRQRQEILLDLAHAPPLGGLTPDTLRLVLDGDIAALIRTHAYVRYQSHVPDHFRNKAFIARHAPQ
ncbi:MAG: hypothetical protein LBR12_00535, partial [Opitutaceae bacterium]|nr:hypothetical protein [Opitutaceae bacterium]